MHCNDQLDDRDLAPILDDSFEDKTGLAPPPILMFADVFDGTISDPTSCCLMKQVGDFTYSLLGEDTLDGSLAARIAASMWGKTFFICLINSIFFLIFYLRKDLPGRRFCFREGDLAPQCFWVLRIRNRYHELRPLLQRKSLYECQRCCCIIFQDWESPLGLRYTSIINESGGWHRLHVRLSLILVLACLLLVCF